MKYTYTVEVPNVLATLKVAEAIGSVEGAVITDFAEFKEVTLTSESSRMTFTCTASGSIREALRCAAKSGDQTVRIDYMEHGVARSREVVVLNFEDDILLGRLVPVGSGGVRTFKLDRISRLVMT